MRLAALYLRSRLAPSAAVALAVVTVLAYAFLRWYDDEVEALRITLILSAVAAATVIGAGTHSPFGEAERAAGSLLPRMRFAHLGGLLVIVAFALALVVAPWQGQDAPLAMARNVAGLSGLSMIGARLLGARLSWIPPLVVGLVALFAPVEAVSWWAWPARQGGERDAQLIAGMLLVLGLVCVGPRGARQGGEENS